MKYESRTKMVRAGTKCHPSEVGNYNFYYPVKDSECEFVSDAVIEEKNWLGTDNLRAVSVLSGFVEGPCQSGNKKSIVWINPDNIEAY